KKKKKEGWVDFIIHSYPSTPVSRQKQNQNLTKSLIFSFCNNPDGKASDMLFQCEISHTQTRNRNEGYNLP
ncbi:hypothetical protein, partial [Acetobacter lovaniensis]|uniref:hypothetical protein n=1 Tax=Acetobacter lovaniensis TaxID=104100 RepID=UPI001C882AD6